MTFDKFKNIILNKKEFIIPESKFNNKRMNNEIIFRLIDNESIEVYYDGKFDDIGNIKEIYFDYHHILIFEDRKYRKVINKWFTVVNA